jgi:hypothetical protein
MWVILVCLECRGNRAGTQACTQARAHAPHKRGLTAHMLHAQPQPQPRAPAPLRTPVHVKPLAHVRQPGPGGRTAPTQPRVTTHSGAASAAAVRRSAGSRLEALAPGPMPRARRKASKSSGGKWWLKELHSAI